MRRMFLAVCLLAASVVHADEKEGEPIVVLTESEGPDSEDEDPFRHFALYPDGRAFSFDGHVYSPTINETVLSAEQLKQLLDELHLERVRNRLHVPRGLVADGATQCIVTHVRGAKHRECIWGLGDSQQDPRGKQPVAPKAMVAIWRRLLSFRTPSTHRWLPSGFDVVVTPKPDDRVRCPKRPLLPWPAGWPAPRGIVAAGPAVEVQLPGSQLPYFDNVPTFSGCEYPVVGWDGIPVELWPRLDRPLGFKTTPPLR